jgi:hypothetical protein
MFCHCEVSFVCRPKTKVCLGLLQGVANSLADIKVQFNDLTQEHQKIVDQFKANIDSLESVFTNATKSSK